MDPLLRPLVISAVLLVAACSESEAPSTPVISTRTADSVISCDADIQASSLSCDSPSVQKSAASYQVMLGGQGVYVILASSGTSYNPTTHVFSSNITVENKTAQPMGTADGTTADPDSIRVFFFSGPTVTSGSGTVTVANAAGTAMFTAPNQPYFQYYGKLASGSTTPAKNWQWNVPASVTHFTFTVMVRAKLPDDVGVLRWLDQTDNSVTAAFGEVSQANNEIWAVGTGGTIRHYNGTSWSTVSDPVPGVTLRGIQMYSGSPVTGFAVGDNSTILKYDGSKWNVVTTTPSGGAAYTTLCKITSTEYYIVGGGGFIGHSTNSGATFIQELPPSDGYTDYYTCGGPKPTDVYVSGLNGTILHSTGNGTWTKQNSNTTYALRAMAWISDGNGGASDIWLTGGTPAPANPSDGVMLHSTGNGTWTLVTHTAQPIRGLQPSDINPGSDIYGVGSNGYIVHWNGTSWSEQSSGNSTQLNHIAFRTLQDGHREWWVVGNNGVVLLGTR